jgi:protein O-GlcNAc transferase
MMSAQSLKDRGNALRATGDIEGAIACYRQALKVEPGYAAALYNLGMCLHETGHLEEAQACFERLIAADGRDTDALFHLGAILQRRLKLDEAARVFRAALEVVPSNPELWIRLGEIGVAQFTNISLAQAEECFRKALELRVDADSYRNLAHVLGLADKHGEALDALRAAFELQPKAPAVQSSLLVEKQRVCDWSRFEELSAAVVDAASADGTGEPIFPFNLVSIVSSPAQQLACARRYAHTISEELSRARKRAAFRFDRPNASRLRIGYLSSEFHEHATAYLAAELFELHDRGRYEVFAYSYGPDEGSAMRQRLRTTIEHFVDVRTISSEAAAAAIHADAVDILVDLKGFTLHARPDISALRPAPVQVSFLGYPGTMGADYIDYLVGDRFVVPAAQERNYSEALVLMPGSYQVNDRQRPVGQAPGRAELGLPRDGFVFCCFNQTYKILPSVFACWMRMLRAVPGSVLWLLDWNPWATANLRSEASKHGVEGARLIFGSMLPQAAHLARIGAADLFVDTFPYTAHTTGSDALWAGLPLLTRSGDTFASRVAGGLLHAVGLPELVTESEQAFELLGIQLAREPERLSQLRARLQRARDTCALFDTPRFVRHLESAYDVMWLIHRACGAPRRIEL